MLLKPGMSHTITKEGDGICPYSHKQPSRTTIVINSVLICCAVIDKCETHRISNSYIHSRTYVVDSIKSKNDLAPFKTAFEWHVENMSESPVDQDADTEDEDEDK